MLSLSLSLFLSVGPFNGFVAWPQKSSQKYGSKVSFPLSFRSYVVSLDVKDHTES